MQRLSKKRDAMNVMLDILQHISEGTTRPTQLMEKANVSWKKLCEYVQRLEKHELITISKEKHQTETYRLLYTTCKGDKVANHYKQLKGMIRDE